MLSMTPTREPVAVRRGDEVMVRSTYAGGRLQDMVVDLTHRRRDMHCLVALPSLPLADVMRDTSSWFRMRVSYTADTAGLHDRVGFMVFVVWFLRGEPVGEQRIRWYAGQEPTSVVQAVEVDRRGDSCQLFFYLDRAQRGTLTVQAPEFVAGLEHLYFGRDGYDVEPVSLQRAWRQEGSRAICRSFFGDHYAEIPEGWDLAKVHPVVLDLVEWFLYDKVEQAFFGLPARTPARPALGRRQPGSKALLSFSLGTDSTAAATLLPPTTRKYYCRRPYSHYLTANGASIRLPSHEVYDQRLSAFEAVDVIDNDFELLGPAAGRRHGYAHGFGYAAVGLLLADHRDAGEIAFGSVMEQVFLRSGDLYADVVDRPGSSVNRLARALDPAGIRLSLPTAGCSEVLTGRLAEGGRHAGLAISCPQPSSDGAPCGTCFKCFRKLRLVAGATPPEPHPSVLETLRKRPLKSATSVVAACQRSGWWTAGVEEYKGVDLGYLDRYYGYALDHLVPKRTAEGVREVLAHFGIAAMSAEDEAQLRSVGAVFSPEEFE